MQAQGGVAAGAAAAGQGPVYKSTVVSSNAPCIAGGHAIEDVHVLWHAMACVAGAR